MSEKWEENEQSEEATVRKGQQHPCAWLSSQGEKTKKRPLDLLTGKPLVTIAKTIFMETVGMRENADSVCC